MHYVRHSLIALAPFVLGILLGLMAAPLDGRAEAAASQSVQVAATAAR